MVRSKLPNLGNLNRRLSHHVNNNLFFWGRNSLNKMRMRSWKVVRELKKDRIEWKGSWLKRKMERIVSWRPHGIGMKRNRLTTKENFAYTFRDKRKDEWALEELCLSIFLCLWLLCCRIVSWFPRILIWWYTIITYGYRKSPLIRGGN